MTYENVLGIETERKVYDFFSEYTKNCSNTTIFFHPLKIDYRKNYNEFSDLCIVFKDTLYLVEIKNFSTTHREWKAFKRRIRLAVSQLQIAEKYFNKNNQFQYSENDLTCLLQNNYKKMFNGAVQSTKVTPTTIYLSNIKNIQKIVIINGIDYATKMYKRYSINNFSGERSKYGGLLINPNNKEKSSFAYKTTDDTHIFSWEQILFLKEQLLNFNDFHNYLIWKNNIAKSIFRAKEQELILRYKEEH